MKKLAIAAALSAITTVATAQSVTVYGIMDTGIQRYDAGADTFTRANDNALATSRLGFRGTEDLGGGLRANFQLEGQLNLAGGRVGSTSTADNEIFNREAWVGISGGLGEVRIGRQDVTYAQDIDTGVSQFGNFGNRATNGTAIELGSDQKNVIKYISPRVAGFTAQLGYASSNAPGATTDGTGDQKGAYLRYDRGALSLHAGHQQNDGATSAAERDFTTYGATYNFGFATAGVTYARGDVSTTGDIESTNTQASVRVPLANGLAAHAIYAVAKNGTQADNNQGRGYTIGVTKALSKRTTLYAAYTSVDNESNSSMAMPGTTAPASAGLDTKAYTAGISHSF
jgi:predicted porin